MYIDRSYCRLFIRNYCQECLVKGKKGTVTNWWRSVWPGDWSTLVFNVCVCAWCVRNIDGGGCRVCMCEYVCVLERVCACVCVRTRMHVCVRARAHDLLYSYKMQFCSDVFLHNLQSFDLCFNDVYFTSLASILYHSLHIWMKYICIICVVSKNIVVCTVVNCNYSWRLTESCWCKLACRSVWWMQCSSWMVTTVIKV